MSRITLALAALALATAGCSGGSEPSSDPPHPTSAPTRLSDVETRSITVPRADFCPRVAPDAVRDALGAEPDSQHTWANGDRVRLARGVTDVAHEFGCRWAAADGTTVQAWVFAPPVAPGRAERLRDVAAGADGCRPVTDAPDFGARSVAVRCADGSTTYHGLFGDAWLSCSLTSRDDDALERAGRWCVSVLQAARG
jgi:hypothetical protein